MVSPSVFLVVVVVLYVYIITVNKIIVNRQMLENARGIRNIFRKKETPVFQHDVHRKILDCKPFLFRNMDGCMGCLCINQL